MPTESPQGKNNKSCLIDNQTFPSESEIVDNRRCRTDKDEHLRLSKLTSCHSEVSILVRRENYSNVYC